MRNDVELGAASALSPTESVLAQPGFGSRPVGTEGLEPFQGFRQFNTFAQKRISTRTMLMYGVDSIGKKNYRQILLIKYIFV